MRILVATGNRGKLRELRRLLDGLPGVELTDFVELGRTIEVVEDGATFDDNAAKKAREVAAATGLATIADDSGLEVDALGGAPGVRSARYAGEGATDLENNAKLLDALGDLPLPRRTARFRCVLAFCPAPDELHLEQGSCEGRIAFAPRGERGFGYDPLFLLGDGRTLGEVPAAVKDRVSHRAAAARAMRAYLATHLAR
jgi:XTP/dITP diphosphohydrolase